VQRDIERRSGFFLPDADHLSRDAVLADMPPDVLASHADYVATSLAGIEQQCSLPILAQRIKHLLLWQVARVPDKAPCQVIWKSP